MENIKQQSDYFGTEKISRILLKMAPPVMLAQLIQALYNIVDSVFVGRYSDSGLTALSIIYATLGSAINSVKNATRPLFKKQATKILKKTVKKIGKEFLGETIEGFATDGIQFGTQKYMEGYFKYMGMAK